MPRGSEPKLRINVELQDDFSLNQVLSLYCLDTLAQLDTTAEDYPLKLLSLVEAILENPDILLRKQLDKLKTDKVGEMKAAGIEYDARMEELEKMEYPKPEREFIYDTFNLFAAQHPWVGSENIKPKSIAREMYERYSSFADYVKLYGLMRAEGLITAPPDQRLSCLGQHGAACLQNRRGGRADHLYRELAADDRFQLDR